MRILLLSPGMLDFYGGALYPILYPRLGLRILAALTPSQHQVTVLEGARASAVSLDEEADLVGISVLTPHARKAYQLADGFRLRGKKVILGGPHPSLNPEEAAQHADAVVIGEGENVWLSLLEDLSQGALKASYHSKRRVNPLDIPTPIRLASDDEDFPGRFATQAGRGCSINCAYCVDPRLFGSTFVPRPPERIVEEIKLAKQLSNGDLYVYLVGNLLGSPEHAKALLERIGPLGVKWYAEGDLFHLNDPDYLDLIRRAGCEVLYVETKLVSQHVNPRVSAIYQQATQAILSRGINLSVNFTIGYDDHDESIVQDIWEWANEGGLGPYLIVQLLTPWPGTPLFKSLDRQGRILTRDWDRYDNGQVVFAPKRMSPERLMRLHRQLWQELARVKKAHFGSVAAGQIDPPIGSQGRDVRQGEAEIAT